MGDLCFFNKSWARTISRVMSPWYYPQWGDAAVFRHLS